MNAPALREYQTDAVNAVEAQYAAGVPRTMLDLATGSGKTTVASEVIRRHVANGARVLVLAGRRELVRQFAARLRLFGLRVGVGLSTAPVLVCSVQSIARRLRVLPRDMFGLVVYDEFHHAVAPQSFGVLNHFASGGALVLGLTATPDRADGVSLGLAVDSCAYRYGVERAIAEGHLVPVRAVRVDVDGMDLSKVRLRARKSGPHGHSEFADLHPADLGRAAIDPAAVEGIVGPLLALAGDLRTAVFAVDIAHALAIAASLRARGATAVVVHGKLKVKERSAALAEFESGAAQFCVNCIVLTEGYDLPAIGCVALCRPTTSRIMVVQCVGRALRPLEGKAEALVLHFVGSNCEHKLVGPEDVLAGAMVAPVAVHRGAAARSALVASPPATYAPVSLLSRFATAVVDIMRRGGLATGRAARRGGKRVVGVVARVVRAILG